MPAWIALAGVALAALAAGASWASVRLNRRQWLLAQQPFLSLQLVIEQSGERVLKILNAGPGPARGVRFCVAAGAEFASGYAGAQFGGYLAPGQRTELVLELSAEAKTEMSGIVICWDGAERVHRFSTLGGRTISRRNKDSEGATDPEQAFRAQFGDAALQGLHRVRGRGRGAP